MIKLGIISAATYGATYRGEAVPRTPGSFHGTAFSSTYNGFDAVKAKQWNWTFATAESGIMKKRKYGELIMAVGILLIREAISIFGGVVK